MRPKPVEFIVNQAGLGGSGSNRNNSPGPRSQGERNLTFDNYYRLISNVMQFAAHQFRSVCAKHGLAVTHQRQVIYQALMSMDDHPSPEVVYEKVRKRIPSISLATVYKNIKTFVDSGLLREVSLHHGSARLETNMDPHHHLVCVQCKAIVDLEDGDLEPVRLKKKLPRGFSVQRYSVEVIGLCPRCSTLGST